MPGIGASGVLGIAVETVSGTYLAPTKFVPFDSESIKWTQENTERRPIRNTAGLVGLIKGNGRVEGDITFDATLDIIVNFLRAARCTYVKTGTAPNFSYVFTPTSQGVATNTLSITVVRNGVVSGYAGCVVGGFTLTVDNAGAFKMTVNIVGNTEAAVANPPSITWPTSVVFGAGMYQVQVPTGSTVQDISSFEFAVSDNAEAQNRIVNSIGARFVKFGENSATIKLTRDFESRADLDKYKNVTTESVSFIGTQGTHSINITTPVSYVTSYEYNLSSVGDLVTASMEYAGAINASGNSYTITIITSEVLP